jgi:hypothetical protein
MNYAQKSPYPAAVEAAYNGCLAKLAKADEGQ